MAEEPLVSLLVFDAGPPLLGFVDDAPLLGWLDDAPLGGYLDETPEIPDPIPGDVDAVSGLLGGPVGERVYTISATLYPDWTNQVLGSGIIAPAIANHPIAGFPIGATFGGGAGPLVIRVSSRDFVTLPTDPDIPSRWWDGRVIDPGSLGSRLPLVPVGEAAIETTVGSVVIDNTDAAFDLVLDQHTAVSQSVDISVGRVEGNSAIGYFADFATILRARITNIGLSESQATLDLQDPVAYAQNLYPTSVYGGLGGETGDADIEGIMKPVVLGKVWNMSPVLINAVALVYQVHDGPVAAISNVFDGGVALSFDSNQASYAALAAVSLSAGEYATCLALGMLRVQSTPAFALTAHVDGNAAAGSTTRSIATWLVGQLDDQVGLPFDAASFAAIPEWDAGWMWSEPFTFAEAISRFVGDAACHWGSGSLGIIRALKLEEPDALDVAQTYRLEDILGLERVPLPDGYGGVHHRRIVRYKRNWTVQADADLAAAASGRGYRQREWKAASATVATVSRNAIDPPILETSLEDVAAAQWLVGEMLDLHGVDRQMLSLHTKIFGAALPELGSTVRVFYPRFGLAGGGFFRIVAIDFDLAESDVNLLLWG
jgi:hypothetical protein